MCHLLLHYRRATTHQHHDYPITPPICCVTGEAPSANILLCIHHYAARDPLGLTQGGRGDGGGGNDGAMGQHMAGRRAGAGQESFTTLEST